jgi:hypothetical protein
MHPHAPLDKQCVFTILVQGKRADDSAFWAYVELSGTKAKSFRKAQASGAFNIEDYGTIIEWGMGEDVPADVQERMEREQGVNHLFEDEARAKLQELADPTRKRRGAPPASD